MYFLNLGVKMFRIDCGNTVLQKFPEWPRVIGCAINTTIDLLVYVQKFSDSIIIAKPCFIILTFLGSVDELENTEVFLLEGAQGFVGEIVPCV